MRPLERAAGCSGALAQPVTKAVRPRSAESKASLIVAVVRNIDDSMSRCG
jgi:hypothetical protein